MNCELRTKIKNDLGISLSESQEYISQNKMLSEKINIWVKKENLILENNGFTLPYITFANNTLRFDKKYEANYLNYVSLENSQQEVAYTEELESIENELQNDENKKEILDTFKKSDKSEYFSQPLPKQIVQNPVNFKEWEDNRKAMIEKLEALANRYRKSGEKIKLKQVNKSIIELKTQLHNVGTKSISLLHESLVKEIELLDKFLDLIKQDSKTALDLIDSNQIEERIKYLSTYFLGKDLNGEMVSETLSELLKETFPKDILEIRNQINDLIDKYKNSSKDIIIGIFEDSSLVKEHKKTMSQDNWDNIYNAFVEIINNNNQSEKIGVESKVLSAKQIDSVVAELLVLFRDAAYSKEAGETQDNERLLKENWLKLQALTDMQGKKITDKLYKKDIFGIITSEIISIYNSNFDKVLNNIFNVRTLFYRKQNETTYERWMSEFKDNVEILEPYKLLSFYNLYKDNPLYKEFFIYSQAEMQEYENKMKEELGNTIFEVESEKQLASVKNYTFEFENNLLGSKLDQYKKNPMNFIRNFHSNNYYKKDTTIGFFLEPTYVSYYPKNDINQEFKELEKETHSKELLDFWKIARKLERYSNPTFQSEGIKVKNNELLNRRDVFAEINNSEASKQVKFFKKIPVWFKTGIENWKMNFASNQDNRINDKSKKDLVLNYVSYGKSKKNALVRKYKKKDLSELYEMVQNEGLDLSKIENVELSERSTVISESLAQIELNKTLSFDMYNSIYNMVQLAKNINTRRASVSVYNLMRNYLKTPNNKDNTELNFLDSWYNLNIKGENFGKEFVPKLRNFTFFKYQTKEEKELEDFVLKEGKNSVGEYDFWYKELNYKKIEDKYYQIEYGDALEITEKEIDKIYDEYIADNLYETGIKFTAGTIALGLKNNFTKSGMAGVKIVGGAANRLAGMIQTMNMAISEEFGFTIEHYNNARRFLMFDNTNKYLLGLRNITGVTKILGLLPSKKAKKIETLKMFADKLRLLDNVLNEFVSGEGELTTLTNDVLKGIFDFSINNPEWKNQMELLLSMMQTIKIKDNNGVEHPIFNGKTQEFIWIPGTLKLKKEFRESLNKSDNTSNILNWEEFKEDDNGNAPQRLLVSKYKSAKMSGQGNYSLDDKAIIENTVTGRVSVMYVKWLAGNSYRQYGAKDLDISTGKVKFEGNKRILAKHAPTLALYLVAVQGNSTLTGISGLMFGTSMALGFGAVGGLVAGGLTVGSLFATMKMLGVFNKNSNFRKDYKNSLKNIGHQFVEPKELLLACSVAREMVQRSVNIVPQFFYQAGPIAEKDIKKRNYKYMPDGMTEEERNLLSASAMDVAQKIGIYAITSLTSLLLTSIFLLSSDDDDEEIAKDFSILENLLNMTLNLKDAGLNDINKFTNPIAFADASSSFAYFNTLNDIRERHLWAEGEKQTLREKYSEGKITGQEYFSKTSIDLARIIGFPAQIAKELTDEKSVILGDERVYNIDETDSYFLNKIKTSEENYEELLNKTRTKYRNDVKSAIRNYYRSNELPLPDDKIISKMVTKFYKNLGLNKSKDDTYEDTYENTKEINLESEIENINIGDLEIEEKEE